MSRGRQAGRDMATPIKTCHDANSIELKWPSLGDRTKVIHDGIVWRKLFLDQKSMQCEVYLATLARQRQLKMLNWILNLVGAASVSCVATQGSVGMLGATPGATSVDARCMVELASASTV
eukprot:CAMPEP_0172696612 /NCGR_PEP_ID=MMETSP1074-20121228/28175_1 /TAXON_ID=2916 /ORGANISM="Ceratium fusus, Strain PA161109" /LENGTH=119 /DNA_ID=CAMNT_0013517385 /DNA_START=64 /DNA_END=420 /DNA_ORIENTATION=+